MKKYVLIGAGARGYGMYAKAITERYSDVAELVAVYDTNYKRSEYVRDTLSDKITVYTDFSDMMKKEKPDCVIITTVDSFHHEYIIKALDFGCDVISEKPMTIDEDKCNEILRAEKRNNKKIVVTFNCRFMPHFVKIKELLKQGVVGEVLNVDFEWMLDTSHGADYFRRWHRNLKNSGGLLVHKATHHFDIINWLIEQDPQTVYANGSLCFYGPIKKNIGERCCECEHKENCEFVFRNYDDAQTKKMYFEAEDIDGYFRDRCIFSDEIDIYDSMSLAVKYSKGALMSYSLIAHSPYEGWKLNISGTNGRIEASEFSSGIQADDKCFHIKAFNRTGDILTCDTKKQQGNHGGGDEKLLRMLLRGDIKDTLNQYAGSRDGAMSALIGIAANRSIKEGNIVSVNSLVNFKEFE